VLIILTKKSGTKTVLKWFGCHLAKAKKQHFNLGLKLSSEYNTYHQLWGKNEEKITI